MVHQIWMRGTKPGYGAPDQDKRHYTRIWCTSSGYGALNQDMVHQIRIRGTKPGYGAPDED
jgi:hypothetical protein